MLDSHLSDLKIVGDLIAAGKFPHTFTMFRRLNIFIRHKMIGYKRNLVLMKYTVHVHFIKFMDCHRTCDIITEDQIQVRLNQLPRLHIVKACMCGKNLLRHRHSHMYNPAFLSIPLFLNQSDFFTLQNTLPLHRRRTWRHLFRLCFMTSASAIHTEAPVSAFTRLSSHPPVSREETSC